MCRSIVRCNIAGDLARRPTVALSAGSRGRGGDGGGPWDGRVQLFLVRVLEPFPHARSSGRAKGQNMAKFLVPFLYAHLTFSLNNAGGVDSFSGSGLVVLLPHHASPLRHQLVGVDAVDSVSAHFIR